MARRKIPADIRSLSRAYTDEGIRIVAAVMRNAENDSTRVAAAQVLFDRGWGKPSQPLTGEDGEGPIVVEIIHRTREK